MRRAVVARLDRAALVDGNVDDNGALLHGLDHFLGDQDRGTCARDEDGADEKVSFLDPLCDVVARGVLGDNAAAEHIVKLTQTLDREVDDRDACAETDSDLCCIRSDVAAADDDDLAGRDTSDTAEEDAAAAVTALEELRADLDGHTACDLTHRSEQREAAALLAENRLIGNTDNLLLKECLRELGLCCEMEVGEEDLTLMEEVILGLQRLFYLNNHFRAIKQSLLVRDDLGANCLVVGIREAAANTGTLLDQNRMTGTAHCLNARGSHTDAELIVLDFLCNAYNHVFPPV